MWRMNTTFRKGRQCCQMFFVFWSWLHQRVSATIFVDCEQKMFSDSMDASKKNDDCYFYYYSSCMKGASCPFRHEPSALGIEIVCNYWKQGKCFKQNCNFRHMEVRKNRNVIPCYWENQPTGCRKPHCPFQHKNTRSDLQANGDTGKDLILPVGAGNMREERGSSADQEDGDSVSASFVSSPPVDPMVVSVEEESDSESMPSTTPIKRMVTHIKTLEQIRLERIQAESAAFYQYDISEDDIQQPEEDSPIARVQVSDVKKRLSGRIVLQDDEEDTTPVIKVLTLEEIRERKRKREEEQKSEQSTDISRTVKKEITSPPENKRIKISGQEIKKKKAPSIEIYRVKASETRRNRILPPSEKTDAPNRITTETGSIISMIKASPPQTRKVMVVHNKVEEDSPSRKKRAHSPVIFDLGSGKKNKEIQVSQEPQVLERKNSTKKPTVAVAARKRPHTEDNTNNTDLVENSKLLLNSPLSPPSKVHMKRSTLLSQETPSDNYSTKASEIVTTPAPSSHTSPQTGEQSPATDTSPSPRPTRRSWRTSRQTKLEEQEETTTPAVFTRKIKLRKSGGGTDSKSDDSSCLRAEEASENNVLDEDSRVELEPSSLLSNDSESNKKYNAPCSLNISSPISTDLDAELSLLSPSADHCENLGVSRGADDILQDIDALLND